MKSTKAVKINKLSVILAVLLVIVGIYALVLNIELIEAKKTISGQDHQVNLARGETENYRKAIFGNTPEAMLIEVNKLRAEVGVMPLELDEKLNASATAKARDMANNNYYDHANPVTGKQGFTYVFDYLGNECARGGENIAAVNYIGADAKYFVVSQWKESKPHYEAMVSAKNHKIGFGVAYSKNGKQYAVQHFCGLR